MYQATLSGKPSAGSISIPLEECTLTSTTAPEGMRLNGVNHVGAEFETIVCMVVRGTVTTMFTGISGNVFEVPNNKIFYRLTEEEQEDLADYINKTIKPLEIQ